MEPAGGPSEGSELEDGAPNDPAPMSPDRSGIADVRSIQPLQGDLTAWYDQFVDKDAMDRFYHMMSELTSYDNPAFGSDSLRLDYRVLPGPSHRHFTGAKPTVEFEQNRSRLWKNHDHDQSDCRILRAEDTSDATKEAYLFSTDWFEARFREILQPWEQWRSGIYIEQSEDDDEWSQSKGIAFPQLDLDAGEPQIRLLVLLPSWGDDDSPLRGCLIVSAIYLHSCYIAIRHSRGHPSFRGQMCVDGRMVSITKNLELFLKHIRSPTKCRVLYIRDLCINRQDPEEKNRILTGAYHAAVENCSCGIVEMNGVMAILDEQGHVPEPGGTNKRLRYENTTEGSEHRLATPGISGYPWHTPAILQQYPKQDGELEERAKNKAALALLPDHDYVPLDIAAGEIRLLAVYSAGDPEDVLVVDIIHAPLSATYHYHALSYCWGSDDKTHFIRTYDSKIAVTKNLHTALIQFRAGMPNGTISMLIWTDMTCINQADPYEKARYIPKMRTIYEAASVVMVYLDDSAYASHSLDQFLQYVLAKPDLDDNRPVNDKVSLDVWADFYRMLKSPYFQRRWIIQELISASVPAFMIEKEIRGLRTVALAVTWMENLFLNLVDLWKNANHKIMETEPELKEIAAATGSSSNLVALKGVDQLCWQVKNLDFLRTFSLNDSLPTFLFLVISTRYARCSDPRDIVYSLWNISKESKSWDIKFSYNTPVHVCYVNFTISYTSNTRSLDLLCVSQCPAQPNPRSIWKKVGIEVDLALPSWCPDFRVDGSIDSLLRRAALHRGHHSNSAMPEIDHTQYHADTLESITERHNKAFSFSSNVLTAQGVILDEVVFTSDRPFANVPVHHITDVNEFWVLDAFSQANRWRKKDFKISWSSKGIPKKGDDALVTEFMSMMAGESAGTIMATWTRKGSPDAKGGKIVYDDYSELRELQDFQKRVRHFIRGRRLIFTASGYMGLAPWHVQKGYKVAILCGCSVPVLLERSNTSSSGKASSSVSSAEGTKWYFRGDCFVQGWMEGEMMKRFGQSTEDAWTALSSAEYQLEIH